MCVRPERENPCPSPSKESSPIQSAAIRSHGGSLSRMQLAREAGLSQTAVSRIWRAFGLQPHRQEPFKLSSDPLFVEKVRDIVGLYMDPPHKAMVLCVDEKSQIQALDRTQPLLPCAQRLTVKKPGKEAPVLRTPSTFCTRAPVQVRFTVCRAEVYERTQGPPTRDPRQLPKCPFVDA